MKKQCFKCKRILPIEDFYLHPCMADGHLNKCKRCARRDVSSNYRANRGYYREYDRKREKRPKRKQLKAEYQSRYRERHAERVRARQKVRRALDQGELTRQPCEDCGALDTEAHHEDYRKPLEVSWLCFTCHRRRHGQLDKRSSAHHADAS